MWLSKIANPEWKELISYEYDEFRSKIRTVDKNKPYYVYVLSDGGIPFYIGKGKNLRAYDHIKKAVRGKDDLKSRLIRSLDQPPTVSILHSGLTESEALSLEQTYISSIGRVRDKGTLFNIMPHGIETFGFSDIIKEKNKHAGKMSYLSGKGIHSKDYDRSGVIKSAWEHGCFDHVDFHSICKNAGQESVKQQRGIHDPEKQHLRTTWAKIGAAALQQSGNMSGSFSKEWRKSNPEKSFEISSKAGKKGGKTTGSKLWWTNGVVNVRSMTRPSEDFVRGMTKGNKNV